MFYHKIAPSQNPKEALDAFNHDMDTWVHACMQRYTHVPPLNYYGQADFLRSWVFLIRRNSDHPVVEFMQRYRDKVQLHYEASGLWKKGYWTNAVVDQGMAHFTTFLGHFWEVCPEDGITLTALLRAAQHLGNWNEFSQPWFDWDQGLYFSALMGTESVSGEERFAMNLPMHFKCIELALFAFRMCGEKSFMQLAVQYGEVWAKAILAEEALPVAITEKGVLYDLSPQQLLAYEELTGNDIVNLSDDLSRAEKFFNANAVYLLLELWQFSQNPAFLIASQKILDILATQLLEPEAGVVAAAIRDFRNFTGSDRYDDKILGLAEFTFPYCIECLAMEVNVERMHRDYGVGKDKFAPDWYENNYPRQHSPLLLALAAEISGNERMATRAIDLARGYFSLARMAFRDGMENGRTAQTVGAIASGHDFDNQAGMVSGVIEPLWERFGGDA